MRKTIIITDLWEAKQGEGADFYKVVNEIKQACEEAGLYKEVVVTIEIQ